MSKQTISKIKNELFSVSVLSKIILYNECCGTLESEEGILYLNFGQSGIPKLCVVY